MPVNNDETARINMRINELDKQAIMRAASLENTNLTEFMIRHSVASAREVIEKSERITLSEADTLLVMDLLDNPPEPNERLMQAAQNLPKLR